jgi:hypothetical protein
VVLLLALLSACTARRAPGGPADTRAPEPTSPADGSGPNGGDSAERAHIGSLLGTTDFRISRVYRTSFEHVEDFFGSFIVAQPHLGTTYHELSPARVVSGANAHHAWMQGTNVVRPGENTNHRGYPTLQFQRTPEGPFRDRVLIELSVWLDVQLAVGADRDWFSFATLCSYEDDVWARVFGVNVGTQGFVHLMHVPGQLQSNHDIFQTDSIRFPMRQWVRLSILIDYGTNNAYGSPYAVVWQDGQRVSAARFNPRADPSTVDRSLWPACLAGWDGQKIEDAEARCALRWRGGLTQAHFGLYAPPLLDRGEVYNDDLVVYELAR